MSQSRPTKVKFEAHEDNRLSEAVRVLGTNDWWLVASAVPNRTARQCRERWCNYLNPKLISHAWTEAEDRLLFEKVDQMGCRWGAIINFFDGRSKNSLRNRYRSCVQRRAARGPRREAPECQPHEPARAEIPPAVGDDPFAFMDRINDEWTFSWEAECEPLFS
jgi:hypothetical protein